MENLDNTQYLALLTYMLKNELNNIESIVDKSDDNFNVSLVNFDTNYNYNWYYDTNDGLDIDDIEHILNDLNNLKCFLNNLAIRN